MMLRIWGRNNSVNVQKAMWCCEEMELPYERVDAGGSFGVVNTQQYRNLNPNGLVPTIEEDGFVLWESNAIVRYLAAKHSAGKLWPEDLKVRAEADKWMDWQNTMFWPTFRPLFWNLVRTPADQRDESAMEDSRIKTAEILEYLDAHLKNRAYVAGDALTMGDIPMGCAIQRSMTLRIGIAGFAEYLVAVFAGRGRRTLHRKLVLAHFQRRGQLQNFAVAHDHPARPDLRIFEALLEREHRRHAAVFTAKFFYPVRLRPGGEDSAQFFLPPLRILVADFPVAGLEVGPRQHGADTIPEFPLQRADRYVLAVGSAIDRVPRFAAGEKVLAAGTSVPGGSHGSERLQVVRKYAVSHGHVDVTSLTAALCVH